MPIRGAVFANQLRPVLREPVEALDGVRWFDVHTHIGENDPDGARATPEEIVEGMDDAGIERALVFPMHEPDGYEVANDAVLAACAASHGRLLALCRVDPKAAGAVGEARRGLENGARGIKLHPRSDDFQLPLSVVEELVALVAQRRGIVLFHAGRGIPRLGEAAVTLAREFPEARIILAHAGISDLGAIGPAAAELPNLLFDTSWWHVSDLLTLMTTVPPGRILFASDMPYGPGMTAAFLFTRTARQAGLSAEQIAVMAGEQARRAVDGEDLVDLGPAVGHAALGARSPMLERVVAHTGAAIQLAFRGGDPAEAVALARLSCQYAPGSPHANVLDRVDELLARALEHRAAAGGDALAIAQATLAAHAIAGTPDV